MNPLFEILFFALLSAYVFYRLWSTLGKPTGLDERPQSEERSDASENRYEQESSDNVISLPFRSRSERMDDLPPKPVSDATFTSVGSEAYEIDAKAEQGMKVLEEKDPHFSIKKFIRGASRAYVMVVEAFAEEDEETLKDLLSPSVFALFDKALAERRSLGEKLEVNVSTYHGTVIRDVLIQDSKASITLQIDSEQVIATKDATGIIHDNPSRLSIPIRDLWTFTRDLDSGSPRWLITSTKNLNDEIES